MSRVNITPVSEIPNRNYRMFALDMTQTRTYHELEFDGIWHELAVFGDSTIQIKLYLNKKGNDAIILERDDTIEISNFVIKKIFVTNSAGTGTTYIWLATKYESEMDRRF